MLLEKLTCWKTKQDSRAAISAGVYSENTFWKSSSVSRTSWEWISQATRPFSSTVSRELMKPKCSSSCK